MYRRPKFLELLHEIREEMSSESNYNVDQFAEIIHSGDSTTSKFSDTKIVKSFTEDFSQPDVLLVPGTKN